MGWLFDNVVLLPSPPKGSGWAQRKFLRFYGFEHPPYELTLYIDSDTRILSQQIAKAPSVLQDSDIAMALATSETSLSRRWSQRPMFTAGVILARSSTRVAGLMSLWRETCLSFHQGRDTSLFSVKDALASIDPGPQRERFLALDQIPLSFILSPEKNILALRARVLPERWNCRRRVAVTEIPIDTIVHHAPQYKRTSTAQVERLAERLPVERASRLRQLVTRWSGSRQAAKQGSR